MADQTEITKCLFGRWTAISEPIKIDGRDHFLCACECRVKRHVRRTYLESGRSKSCGCLARSMTSERGRTHGMSRSSIYLLWRGMIDRCENSSHQAYVNYGARGIGVCKEWRDSFDCFYRDMGDKPNGMTLDRKDNDKGYSKENCRWATHIEQMRNTRAKKGALVKGVNKSGKYWKAYITTNYKKIYLGSSKDFFEACCLRKSAEISFWKNENHNQIQSTGVN